ncbi:hypothetical protein GE061_016334 [Apolygus lucorum]|uniref:Peptidase M14 domain-containing protein n=1 Tax=Apolygus lucorum TaxID=248454 RepID=A0A6A4JS72_APOLU|nr:hypothetical protein GE061_016334 [Apolygus lucorum]
MALSGFMKDLINKENVSAYVAVHANGQCILHPYGYSLTRKPKNLEVLVKVGGLMRDAMLPVAGNPYPVKSAAELYVAGGGSDDWAYDVQSIPLVFTLELGYRRTGFNPKEPDMKALVRECFAALGAIAKFLDPSIDHETVSAERRSTGSIISVGVSCPTSMKNKVENPQFPTLILLESLVISVPWILHNL